MAGKKQSNDPGNGLFGENPPTRGIDEFKLTPEHVGRILHLVGTTNSIKASQEMLADDYKGAATAMGLKPADVKEMVGIVIQEQEKGGVLLAKEKKLNLARQVIDGMSNAPHLESESTDQA